MALADAGLAAECQRVWAGFAAVNGITPEDVAVSFRALVEGHAGLGSLFEIGDGIGVAAWIHSRQAAALDGVTTESVRTVAPSWFLDFVGVDPDHQGKGFGAALVRFGLARARADGGPAVLETAIASNVPFYEHLGFHVAKDIDAPASGPHVWFLRADPR